MEHSDFIPFEDSGFAGQIIHPPKVDFRLADNDEPRLNIVLPNFFKNFAFGGITSAMVLGRELSRHYRSIRFVSLAPLGPRKDMFDFAAHVAAPEGKSAEVFTVDKAPLPVHQNDIFMCTYWKTQLVWQAHAKAMRENNLDPTPFYYMIQDYEPGFYPFGYQRAMCMQTYSETDHVVAVFNSSLLTEHFHSNGFEFKRQYTIEPSLNPVLKTRLESRDFILPGKPEEKITILAYGRPGEPRNCFLSVVEGLNIFLKGIDKTNREVQIFSAGQSHDNLILPGGIKMQSLGKLDLEHYADILENAHIGVSLMDSPHPSYPPLEMALFGLYTITNSYKHKNISQAHPMLHSIDLPTPEMLAKELTKAVEWVTSNTAPVRATLPDVLSPLPWKENVRLAGIKPI